MVERPRRRRRNVYGRERPTTPRATANVQEQARRAVSCFKQTIHAFTGELVLRAGGVGAGQGCAAEGQAESSNSCNMLHLQPAGGRPLVRWWLSSDTAARA
jgi:hypothetical protein